jgi:c(7)-type cytochrome triheme protein
VKRAIVLASLTAIAVLAALMFTRRSDGAMPATIRIPIVRAHGKGDPAAAALFSHWSHGELNCFACHPSLFPQALVGFTHDDLDAGRYCAACHDGKSAWAVDDQECKACHRD